MNLFQLFKSDSKEEISKEKPLEEIIDFDKPEEKIPMEYRKPDKSYNIILEAASMPDPDNPEKIIWEVTAKHNTFAIVGTGDTFIKAKRNLYSQLKKIEKFSRVALVMVGVRTGILSCSSEFKNGEGDTER